MKNRWQTAIRWLLALVMLVTLLPISPIEAKAAATITAPIDLSSNPSNTAGAGWEWKKLAGELTLDGLDLQSTDTGRPAIILPDRGVTIKLSGINTIVSASPIGIFSTNSVTIEGSGSLSVTSGTSASMSMGMSVKSLSVVIDAISTVTTTGGAATGNGESYGLYLNGENGVLSVVSGTLLAFGGDSPYYETSGIRAQYAGSITILPGATVIARGGASSNGDSYGLRTVDSLMQINLTDPTSTLTCSGGTDALRIASKSIGFPSGIAMLGKSGNAYSVETVIDSSDGMLYKKSDPTVQVLDARSGPVPQGSTVTLTVNKNGAPYANHGKTFRLKKTGQADIVGTGTGGTVTFSSVPSGTYDLYDGTTDTGVNPVAGNNINAATINYYTVSFAVTDAGAASGSTISAMYNGASIQSGAEVIGGNVLTITAAGAGASSYIYTWMGTGTSGETTATLTNMYLGTEISATCVVTGTVVPTIAVSTTGLTGMKVGQAASGASVVYTLSGSTYNAAITAQDFTVADLPAGLTAGTPVRTSDTVVTIPITGTPTTARTSIAVLGYSYTIPAANITGAGSSVMPTGVLSVGAVSKGDGAALSGVPTVNGIPTESSIAVNVVTNAGTTGQSVEYAISAVGSSTPDTGWQSGTTFTNLLPGTTYYVYARTAGNANYEAGTAQVSAAIATASLSQPCTLTGATADGASGTTTSTRIDLTFDTAIIGLTASDITITNGTGTVTKSALIGSGTNWTIALSSVASEGDVSVAVASPAGFTVSGSPKTVTVYKAAVSTPAALLSAVADGAAGTTTSTKIDLKFDNDVTGLTAENITITNGTGSVTKGALTGSGADWSIALASVATEGNVSVAVSAPAGFTVSGSPKTAAVYKASSGGDPEPVPTNPTITTQPAATTTVAVGGTTTLSVVATVPSGTLTYQWYYSTSNSNASGTEISGATSASYTTASDLTEGTHYFYCIVGATGATPVASSVAAVNVVAAPTASVSGNNQLIALPGSTFKLAFVVDVAGNAGSTTEITLTVGGNTASAPFTGNGTLVIPCEASFSETGEYPVAASVTGGTQVNVGTVNVINVSKYLKGNLASKLSSGYLFGQASSGVPIAFRSASAFLDSVTGMLTTQNKDKLTVVVAYSGSGKVYARLVRMQDNPFAPSGKALQSLTERYRLKVDGKRNSAKKYASFEFSARSLYRLQPGYYQFEVYSAASGKYKGFPYTSLATIHITEGQGEPVEWTLPTSLRASLGQQYKLVVPTTEGAVLPELSASSSSKKIATIDSAGILTAKKPGKATIKVRMATGGYKSCVVTVASNCFSRTRPLTLKNKAGLYTSTKRLSYKNGALNAEVFLYNRTGDTLHNMESLTFELYDGVNLVYSTPLQPFELSTALKNKRYSTLKLNISDQMLPGVGNEDFDLGIGRYSAVVRGTDDNGHQAVILRSGTIDVSEAKSKDAKSSGSVELELLK